MAGARDNTEPRIRGAEDRDAEGVIQLIARCFSEYPGCILDCDTEEPGLRHPGRDLGRFWIAEADDDVVGCVGCIPGHDVDRVPGVELKKLYVHPDFRRRGLGRRLVELVERECRTSDRAAGSRVWLWSDIRFRAAHAVYQRLGYHQGPERRDLCDLSATVEFRFAKELPSLTTRSA